MDDSGRQPDAPQFPATPLELLTPREGEGFSFFDKHGLPLLSGLIGVGGSCFLNRVKGRPIYAGIQVHFLMGGLLYYLAKGLNYTWLEGLKEHDAVLKHYVSLHPDDFPPYERYKIKELYGKWIPYR